MGVDSLSAMFRLSSDECPEDYKITILTNFNVGAYGNDLNKSHVSFKKDLILVRQFANELNLPVLTIESNMGIMFKDFNFDQCGPLRTMSTGLSMQKLFSKYYYASGTSNEEIEIVGHTMCHYAQIIIPLLSTESTELIVADSDKNRTQKTISIADNPLTKKYLHVCWREIIANEYNRPDLLDSSVLNCTRCDKCQRTLMALEILGKSEGYKGIFDFSIWEKERINYIAKIIDRKEVEIYKYELWMLMKEYNYPIPFAAKKQAIIWKLERNYFMSIPIRFVRLFKRIFIKMVRLVFNNKRT